MATVAYISRRVVLPEGVRAAAIIADSDSGVITRMAEADAPGPVDAVHDFGEHALLPGLIDAHVHLNDPGRTEWEGFATGTRAAAAGGVTTVVDMPLNSLPETSTVDALQKKREAATGQCMVDWRAWGGAQGSERAGVRGNQEHLLRLAAAGAAGFKCFLVYPGCDGLGMIDEAGLREAMPLIAQTGLPLLVHAELPEPIEAAAAGLAGRDWRQYGTYLASRPDAAELAAIRMMIGLVREMGRESRCRVHIVHLATAQALPMLRDAKAEGLPITVETCPHYLHFAAEQIADGATLFKCAPPIRGEANRELLWSGVADGTIDLICSDHSPCPPQMKGLADGDFQTAWGGVASLSLTASVVWTGMTTRGLTLEDLTRCMAAAPARLAGIAKHKGRIGMGQDADFVVFAPGETFTVTNDTLYFRHRVSPYVGERLTGVVKETILRGKSIFKDGVFSQQPAGREVKV